MSIQIRIVPDELHSGAHSIREVADTVNELLSRITMVKDMVSNAWESASGREALNNIDEIRSGVNKMSDGIMQSANKLESIVSAFESLDNNGSNATASIIAMERIKFVNIVGCPAPTFRDTILNFPWALPGMLRIIPDELQHAAQICLEIGDAFQENGNRYHSIMEKLRSSWEGNACNRYIDECQEIVVLLNSFGEIIEEFGQKLLTAANRYEELDNSL